MVEELIGGAEGARTPDPKTASLVLSQLSYSPTRALTLQGACGKCQGREGRCPSAVVPAVGFEPTHPCGLGILSPDCLPVPARRHAIASGAPTASDDTTSRLRARVQQI